MPPVLLGGELPKGAYTLSYLHFYPDSLTAGEPFPLEMILAGQPNTYGSIIFSGGEFGISAHVEVIAEFPELDESTLWTGTTFAGGCIDGAENFLFSNVLECLVGQVPDFEIPEAFPYETTEAGLKLLIPIDKDFLLVGMPQVYQELAALVFVDALQVVAIFTKAD